MKSMGRHRRWFGNGRDRMAVPSRNPVAQDRVDVGWSELKLQEELLDYVDPELELFAAEILMTSWPRSIGRILARVVEDFRFHSNSLKDLGCCQRYAHIDKAAKMVRFKKKNRWRGLVLKLLTER